MRENIERLLVGYDKKTDQRSYSQKIPDYDVAKAMMLVEPDESDPEVFASYPLDFLVAKEIMTLGSMPCGDDRLEYFLETRALAGA